MDEREIRILVVEDEAAHVALLRRAFERHPGRTRLDVASSLRAARQHIAEAPPDLVLADLRLPDGRGLELLLAGGGAAAWPLILMTGYGDEQVAVAALKAGALDYVVKSAESLAAMPRLAARVLREWGHLQQRRRAEAALRASEERLRRVMEDLPLLIDAFDEQNRPIFWNRECERVTGYTAEEMIGNQDGLNLLYPDPDERARRVAQWRHVGGYRDGEWIITCKDGGRRAIAWSSITVDLPGSGASTWHAGLDVTERRRAAAERAHLVAAIEHANDIIFITDPGGSIRYVNPAFARLTGYGREELIGTGPDFFPWQPPAGLPIPELIGRLAAGESWQGRCSGRARNGAFTVECSAAPVRGEDGHVTNIVLVARDVTRVDALEARLRQAEKLEAIGTLAGGIAHDFNNILYAIVGFTELVMDDVPADSRAMANLEQVCEAGRRATELVRRILTFSRGSEQAKRALALQPLVAEVLALLRGSLPPAVEIRQRIDPDCGPVWGDAGRLHQVIMNLCTNAFQAMPGGAGRMEVILAETTVDAALAEQAPDLSPGPHALLVITDDGLGMDTATRERIFEPYFTTKDPGAGTGLGLATVHGAVRDHGGAILVESEPGRGSRFAVYLPLHSQPAAAVDPAREEV
ncbi:MAG: PAS domain S-box protein [Candidatus Krumholzibacteriota bacterium]|nr:PAS domain S-box protein [Candidatus Krumholzibacteriota bacterium]